MLWTLFGLTRGQATSDWPAGDAAFAGQAGVEQLPRFDAAKCQDGCRRCAQVCLPQAITLAEPGLSAGAAAPAGEAVRINLDLGRCIGCRLCIDECPTGAFSADSRFDNAVTERQDLRWREPLGGGEADRLKREIDRAFAGSLHVRHVDAGSCNGCESELKALNNPFYNLHRLGVFFTPSPRFADLLLVTGTHTYAMRQAVATTLEGMPRPRWVMAVGACAISGGPAQGGYASGHGLDGVLEVDAWVPGCPPSPAAIIHALLMLVSRAPQTLRGGRRVE